MPAATWVALPCRILAALPATQVRVAGLEERPGCFPAIFDYVHEVAENGEADAAPGGLGLDRVDLRVVPVGEGDPSAAVVRVAALGLIEPSCDDAGDVAGDRGGQPFPCGLGPRGPGGLLPARRGDDAGQGAGLGLAVIDGGQLGRNAEFRITAIRLRPLFSPGDRRVASLFLLSAAALAVAGRSAPGSMTTPLPSHCRHSTTSSADGPGRRPVQNASTSAAARRASSSTWRFPTPTPVVRLIAAAASWCEPRADSTTASLRSPSDCCSPGRFSCAPAGCTFGAPPPGGPSSSP